MSLLTKLPIMIDECKKACREIASGDFAVLEKITNGENLLVHSDNLTLMKYLLEQKAMGEKINLIYIDPPFYSKANYGTERKLSSEKIGTVPSIKQNAYQDVWEEGMESYLRMLTERFFLMKELLAEDGCLWVHLDWHSVHYVKVILDEIFGEKNFINEVIWNYKSGGVSKNYFARKHDTLLFYAKSSNYYFKAQQEKSYNRDLKPYRFKGVDEFKDAVGWYTMVNMKDVWQINMVGRTSAERTGYATQKPEQLIERILESCTREGDLCADFFCGSGTLPATADRMGRRWIACDLGDLAAANTHKRMVKSTKQGYTFLRESKKKELNGKLKVKTDLRAADDSDKMKLAVTLTGYEIESISELPVEKKQLPVIKEIISKDALQLLDYWSIDFEYDGVTYSPQHSFCKGRDTISLGCEWNTGVMGTIAIRCIDIFGNNSFQIIPIGGKDE